MEKPIRETPMPTLEEALAQFLRELTARNLSDHTITAYATDIKQFLSYLHENTISTRPDQVTKTDLTEYLSILAGKSQSGVTRARKLAALRTFFQHLVTFEIIPTSPAAPIAMPKKERKQMVYLQKGARKPCVFRPGMNGPFA
jgi:site-specific recombinase XerD